MYRRESRATILDLQGTPEALWKDRGICQNLGEDAGGGSAARAFDDEGSRGGGAIQRSRTA